MGQNMKQEEIDFSDQIKEAKSEGCESRSDQERKDLIEKKVKANLEKYGIDITGFYDNAPKPIIEELKEMIVQWEENHYPNDQAKWESYFQDLLTLIHRRSYNSKFDG
jgi:hypothetical protein